MSFLDKVTTPKTTPKASTSTGGGFLDKVSTSPQNSQPVAPQTPATPPSAPIKLNYVHPGSGVSLTGPLGGTAQSTQAVPTASTPNITPVSVAKGLFKYEKEFLTGGADTAGGTARNTVLGIPKAAVKLATGVKDTVVPLVKAAPAQLKTDSPLRRGLQEGLLQTSSAIHRFDQAFYETIGAKSDAQKMKVVADADQAFYTALSKEGLKVNDDRTLKEKIKDPEYFYRTLGQNTPNLLASLGVGLVTGGLGAAPALSAGATGITGGAIQFGSTYNDAIQKVGPEQAKKVAVFTALGNSFLEALPAFRVFKKLAGTEAVDLFQKTFAKNLTNKLLSVAEQASIEGGTESLQSIYENAIKQTYDSNQQLFAGVAESGLFGAIMGAGTDVGVQAVQGAGNLADKIIETAKNIPNKKGGFIKLPIGKDIAIPEDIDVLPITSEQKNALQAVREGATSPDVLDVIKTIPPKVFEAPETSGFLDRVSSSKESLPTVKQPENTPITPGNVPETKTPAKAPVYEGETDLTTKILKDLEGKSTVSKQYILDATNRGELKQAERDVIRQVLESETGKEVKVADFAKKVKAELLPLSVKNQNVSVSQARKQLKDMGYTIEQEMDDSALVLDKNGEYVEYDKLAPEAQKLVDRVFGTAETYSQIGGNKYENIALPGELRGKVKNYKENIYESPVQTNAGSTHFSGQTDNYFGHTRIEDMADNQTRRVIEVQSDLYQKGNLENEVLKGPKLTRIEQSNITQTDLAKKRDLRNKELARLQQYNDPTAHFRMVREEIKKASQDGKTKLQFPTGETAMKIEGLGDNTRWMNVEDGIRSGADLRADDLKVGKEITMEDMDELGASNIWIITDVLGDGKFKAVPNHKVFPNETGYLKAELGYIPAPNKNNYVYKKSDAESFDISGKVDTSNPIYKFYEKDLGKYLNKFGAQRVTDSKGVTWYEIPVSKAQSGAVEAFNKRRPLLNKDIYMSKDEIREILFKDIPKNDLTLIFTQELIQGVADGSFEVHPRLGNLIKLYEQGGKVSLITALHESKHYFFSKLSPEIQKEALEIAKKEMGPLYKKTLEKMYKDEYNDSPDKISMLLEEYVVDKWSKSDAAKGFGYKQSVYGKIFSALDNLLKRMITTYNNVKSRADAFFKSRGGSKGGYINFGGEKPKKTPLGKSVGKVTIGGKEVDITKGGTMDIPVAKAKNPVAQVIKDIPAKTKELITQDLFNEYSQVEAKKQLKDEKTVKDILTFKERQNLIKSEIDMSKLEKENIESSISEEAKGLMKYKSKVTGELPEVTGKEKVSSPTTGKQIENSLFGRRGDQIVQGLGFKDLESAQNAFDTYLVQRARVNDIKKTISEKVKDYRDKKQIIEAVEAMLRKEGRERANQVSLIQDFFKLSDSEFKEITKKTPDFRLMTDERFQGLLKEVYNKSYDAFTLAEARMKLKATIFEKELLKVDNLQQAEKLPKIENMSLSQLENFNTLLESFKQGDAFLGVRQLQTIKNTDLAGIKTKREVIDDLAKRTGKPIDQLKDISVNKFVDRMLYDTALARKNPFYEILVDDTNTALVGASLRFTEVSNTVDDLMAKARSSRKRGLVDKIIPTDDLIFSYLEASPEEKLVMMKRMTKEEADAALYIQEKYAEARDYLVQREQLKTRYWDNYITHLPTGFLETWKNGIKDFNLKKAINDVLASFKEQEKIVNILDQKTGSVLPLEKFMRFTLTREGFSASHDVARAVTAYFRVFENKIALDQIIPKLDVYVHVLTPQKMTPRGLEFDDSLKTFWKEWMNNKKGRISAGIIKQGTTPMWMVKSGIAFTRILDLGLNIPVGIASHVGEQVGTFVNLGTKKYTLGLARYSTPTGRAIAKKYQGFVGETLLQKLTSPTVGLKDKVTTMLFGLFSSADRKANIVHLLGSMSPEEFKTKTISTERLGKMKTEMGKYRVTTGDASIWQKTALGQVAYQYKKWAEPIMLTNVNNIKKVASMLKNGDKNVINTTEFKELFRSVVVTSLAVVISYGLYRELRDKKEKDFLENLAFKAMNDSLSLLSALNPNTYTSYRLLSFIKDITASMTLISSSLLMNDRTAKGAVPGLSSLKSNITPKLIKQFVGKKKTIGEDLHDKFIKSKDKREFLANLLETDPDGADKLIAELQKEALGITDEDEKILNMGVKNGQRARAVVKEYKKLKTKEERIALLMEYKRKKILTVDVLKQVIVELNK